MDQPGRSSRPAPGIRPHNDKPLLASCDYVLAHIHNTVAALAGRNVYLEIVLAENDGEVVSCYSSAPARRLYPCGSRLDASLVALPDSVAEIAGNDGRIAAGVLVPVWYGGRRVGLLAALTEGGPPLARELAESWAALAGECLSRNLAASSAPTRNEQVLQIMNTIQDGFMAADKDGIVTFLNRAGEEIFGMRAEDVIGRHMVDAFKFEPQLLKVLATGVGWTDREFHITLPHGGQVHLIKSAIPVFSEAHEVIGVVDTFRKFTKIQHLLTSLAGRSLLTFDDLIAESPVMTAAIVQARKAAANLSTVLLEGESGTGKELFAQAIHKASARAGGPFIVIDCASLPRELIESELFGYVEGTFTGGSKGGRPGKFELANGGTVLLDEIGEMPLDLQPRLLRVLQSRTVTRLGSSTAVPVDIMIIAATNKNLRQEVAHRNFRQDLFYRLNIVSIEIPPLRRRQDDIPALARHFTRKISARMGRPAVAISSEAVELLSAYPWPGNVRELENAIERACSLLEGDTIDPGHLPAEIRGQRSGLHRDVAAFPPTINLAEAEKALIASALARAGGNRCHAAKMLGISRSTLYEKMKLYDIS